MKTAKIIFGVCGIGNGHTQRELPLIEHFAKTSQIVIFAYDSSYKFFTLRFADTPNVSVLEVAVPFYVENKDGIDLKATAKLPYNTKNFDVVNKIAKTQAEQIIGIPDLVISDYEPISAQYAYEHNVRLVTIDQQSKYLVGEFPANINEQTCAGEIARLRLFFPKADARIACSFFNITQKEGTEQVIMFAPTLKDSVINMTNSPTSPASILVYFSSQQDFPQSLDEVAKICATQPKITFHVFAPTIPETNFENVNFYKHGDEKFTEVLQYCSGIISTAGHTLISEAMHLNIPVYAIPLPVYEQHMNAHVIDENGFGITSLTITDKKLEEFISKLSEFHNNIQNDTSVLLKNNGKQEIIHFLEANYLV